MTAGWAQVNSVPGRGRPPPPYLAEGQFQGGNEERMQGRSGPFWDGVQGQAPIPPAAATLGFEFIDADVEAGTIQVAFAATEAFTNPAGIVLGAFLAAMLFDTVGGSAGHPGARPVPR